MNGCEVNLGIRLGPERKVSEQAVGIVVYVDGLCQPVNPGGIATFGYMIRDDGIVRARESGIVGKGPAMSNNVAEYAALFAALEFLLKNKLQDSPIEVRSDSTLVVNQMSGGWKLRKGLYREKYLETKRLSSQFSNLRFRWIPREDNEGADRLSREAYERAHEKP